MALQSSAIELDRAGSPVRPSPHGVREQLGDLVGRCTAPLVAGISRARHARMFHPDGLMFAGTCEPVDSATFGDLGDALRGRVLARCSPALWRNGLEHLEVLGIALRFRPGAGPDLDDRAADGDQDLLFATILSPLTMPLSPFTTDATDFLANEYRAVAPFEIGLRRRIKLRLRPVAPIAKDRNRRTSRSERLRDAVLRGRAHWQLEARQTLHLDWQAIARLSFDRPVQVDQDNLRFDPFRTGAGFVPVGFVHEIRRAVYRASQAARPHGARAKSI